MDKINYIKYRSHWYNVAPLDTVIKHLTRETDIIIRGDVWESVESENENTGGENNSLEI